MSAQTVKKVMEQRLTRGTPVIVGESFGKAALRGERQIVASKGPVKCNKGGRCAGKWCIGLAVFVTSPESLKEDKEMGWRGGTTKVCLTHIKDEDGHLILAPPALRDSSRSRISEALPRENGNGHTGSGVVTWEDLANAAADKDMDRMTLLARKLKRENEELKSRVIETQQKLIDQLR